MPGMGLDRFIIRLLIPELYSTYKSANRALKVVREMGLAIRTKTFYEDWREILKIPKQKDTWKKIPRKYAKWKDMVIDTGKNLSTEFQYVGKMTYLHAQTGEVVDKWISFGSDSFMFPEEAQEKLWGVAEEGKYIYEVAELYDVSLENIFHRRG
jgi:hypothetical protein